MTVEEKVMLPEAELVSVVAAPKVTAFPKVCTPLVLIEPPLSAVVPLLEFCTTVLAATVELKVVVPVLVKEMFPRPCAPPTAPVKVMLLEPTLAVRLRGVLLSLLTVLLNDIALLVVANVALAAKVTAPV